MQKPPTETTQKWYRPTIKEAREYDDRDSYMEISKDFVFTEGGGCETSFTHRVFKKMIEDYQKWEKKHG